MDKSFLVDSHAHLDMSPFDRDRAQVIADAKDKKVEIIVNIGIDLDSSRASINLAERYPGIFATVGFHPHEAKKMTDSALQELDRLCAHPKVVAVGEIGLDFYRNLSPRQVQLEVFRKQLALARRHNLPVVIHSRNAPQDTLTILAEWAEPGDNPLGVLHCFGGDDRLAWKYVELGFLISMAGPVTHSAQAAQVVSSLPLEKLVVETDCPFLTPQPYKDRRNQPAYLTATVEKIAQIKETPAEAIARITSDNAIRLFRLTGRIAL